MHILKLILVLATTLCVTTSAVTTYQSSYSKTEEKELFIRAPHPGKASLGLQRIIPNALLPPRLRTFPPTCSVGRARAREKFTSGPEHSRRELRLQKRLCKQKCRCHGKPGRLECSIETMSCQNLCFCEDGGAGNTAGEGQTLIPGVRPVPKKVTTERGTGFGSRTAGTWKV
jgi:hypothetical protein